MLKVFNITRNHLADGDGARNLWNVRPDQRDVALPVSFRLCDDDGEVYLSGRATCEHAVLMALDGIGENYGCTIAQTRVAGRWEALN